jgi:beta-N-acetylhexosaminidase
MRRAYDSLRTEFVSSDDVAPDFQRLLSIADSVDVVVLGSYVNISSTTATAGAPRAFVEFVSKLQLRNPRTVLISFGTPYLLQQTPSVSSYVIAWGPSQASQQAAGRALIGTTAITGRLPISIPPLARFGDGEQRGASR